MTTKKRVALIGIFHESNTFIPTPTTIANFRRGTLLFGEEIRREYGHAHHEIGGFFETLDQNGVEAVPIIFTHASPWGAVSDAALDAIWEATEAGLDAAGQLDGVLVAPHGAAVNESRPDMDAWWLAKVREKVGPDLPIISTMDPHGNISRAKITPLNALITYRENPHLDMRQRGVEAATLMVRTLAGEIRPVVAAAFPPVVINIERQLTWAEPMKSIQRQLDEVRALPGILSASVAMGFPYADVADMGSSFVVVADGDATLAQCEADKLAAWLVENRQLFVGEMISAQEAIERARTAPKPVGLLDMGDNAGGGAPADSTYIARLLEQDGTFKSILCIQDRPSVEAAKAAGVGARVRLSVGGKLPMSPAPSLEVEATVISFHEGIFKETQPRHGGKTGGDMGLSVIAKTDRGLTLVLMSNRTGIGASAQPLLSIGIKPEEYDIIILKGVHAPVGAYAEICPTLIRVNTPGVTTAEMETLTYHHRRKPLFPFEEI